MAKAADILRKDAVIIPLLAKKGVGLFHPDLQGFTEPRVAVAIEFAMATRQAFGDDGFEFFSSHSGFLSAADLVTDTQQMNGRRTGDDQG